MDPCKIVWTLWLAAFVFSLRNLLVPKLAPQPKKIAAGLKEEAFLAEANRLILD